ncbi:fumarylacetoacetate hydrolase family protein [Lentzea pudingi]|uniref:fumarylacetoacetate hydrolase family protein n=1 Tax=Lentzea pudingi TaxID=1789439 RepID=UPI001E5A739F|nr:fumarylacetoacetate hydrolase family protein [Lentzea pudingi]
MWGLRDSIVDISDLIDSSIRPDDRMNALIEHWPQLRPAVEIASRSVGTALSDVVLRAPQPRPTKIVAAAANHAAHLQEMTTRGSTQPSGTIEKYRGFLKAPSSIVGPDAAIELPYHDRRIDHEGELGVVMGARARRVTREDALRYVFGYVPLLDITMRGEEDRPYRKSFDTFTPIGPAIVTADEVPDPDVLDLQLRVNGEVRQRGNTAEFIYDVPRLIEVYSEAMTLEPGDIIATGTVDGVSRLVGGDVIALTIEGLPTLHMPVLAADLRPSTT